MDVEVWHYDGRGGQGRSPRMVLTAEAGGFVLDGDGADPGPYVFADLVPKGHGPHDRTYGLKGRPGWRISFQEFPPSEIALQLPKPPRYAGWVARFGRRRVAAVFAVIGVLFVGFTLKLPPLIARLMPQAIEQRMGRMMVDTLDDYTCSSPAGDAALRVLGDRLGQQGKVTIRIVRAPMINAAAFPGGQVVLFDGLIQNAESPDEVAGVLSHELGHVAHRDGMQWLFRQFGLRLLFGGFDHNVATYTHAVLNARYANRAERGADAYAVGHLQAAHISPRPTAALFARLAERERQPGATALLFDYLGSHPISPAREQYFADGVRPGATYTPALTPAQWQALRTMCEAAAR